MDSPEKTNSQKVMAKLDNMEGDMVQTLCELIRIKAVGPENGGGGEWEKARHIEKMLREWGITDIKHLDAPDADVKEGTRPNMLATVKGERPGPKMWLISHMDVVPKGEASLWDSNPFEPVVKGGKIIGRGSEDNGQELVSSIYALKAILEDGLKPKYDTILCLVSDEETGSQYGLQYLLKQGIFNKDDLIVITDAGNEEGDMLEVAEKSIIWVKATIVGKQAHASLPNKSINAHRAAALLVTRADKMLHEKFSRQDDLYDVPYSSFEPTKREAGVPNVNTIPGEEIVYFDCRVLPEYDLDDVMKTFDEAAEAVEKETDASIKIEAVQSEKAAPPTPPDAKVVEMLRKAVDMVHHNSPYPGGIGGGTVAALLRKQGLNVVVYGKIDDMAHAPNEYARIENLVGSSKVYACLALME